MIAITLLEFLDKHAHGINEAVIGLTFLMFCAFCLWLFTRN